MPVIENKIQRAFSRAATKYDDFAGLQMKIGQDLLASIPQGIRPGRILDVGMGTGCLTEELTRSFPTAKIVGMDFASGMVHCAKEKYQSFSIIQADAVDLPFQKGVFNLVVSNLAYQWVDDLEKAFGLIHATLKGNGVFCMTMFGHNSLSELFTSLESSFNKKGIIERLPAAEQVHGAICQAGFKTIDFKTEMITGGFADMRSLLKWLKGIGANGIKRNVFVGKERIFKASKYYDRHFKDADGVYATFEVIRLKAEK